MGEPRRGAKPAGTGPDHDSIRTNNRHFTSQKARCTVDPGCP